MISEEQLRWAEAATIERQYGEAAPIYVAERIGALALAGDVAGVTRFKEIAARLVRLRGGERPS